MNVARINMSHGTHESHRETITRLKKAREEKGASLAIMLDTKGPEVRVGKIEGDTLHLNQGDLLTICKNKAEVKAGEIYFTPERVVDDIPLGAQVLFDDGYMTSKVVEKHETSITVEIANSGVLKSSKGVHVPRVDLSLPAVTDQDIADIIFGVKEDVDIFAVSFIRSKEHILTIKKLLKEHNGSSALVVAKIESALGVENFDEILAVSDGIMVARGDLGVELPVTQVPKLQKLMIRKCYQAFKPVATATQMLESMIENPRPTRAEVSDVANAIYDSTSAVMLSGETAVGKFPIETVNLMRSTILEAEKDFEYQAFFLRDMGRTVSYDTSSSVALAAIKTAYSGNGKALVAFTTSGFTARMMARFRPEMPILAITSDQKVFYQLSFIWGVVPVYAKVSNLEEGKKISNQYLKSCHLASPGDLIVMTSGSPFGVSGTTNMMVVETVD